MKSQARTNQTLSNISRVHFDYQVMDPSTSIFMLPSHLVSHQQSRLAQGSLETDGQVLSVHNIMAAEQQSTLTDALGEPDNIRNKV